MAQTTRGELPARLARLAGSLAIIFVRESAATAAISAATAATTPAAAARRSPAFGLGASFVHLQITTPDLFSIKAGDCLRRFFIIRHFHKSEAARPAGLPVHRHVNARDLPKSFEQFAQFAFGGLEIHIANKQVLHFPLPPILLYTAYFTSPPARIHQAGERVWAWKPEA